MIKMKLHEAISTVAGLGYLRYAPGTAGSVAGLVCCFLLRGNTAVYLLAFLILFFVGVVVSDKTEKDMKTKDPSCIVIDEFACIFVVFFMIPMTIVTIPLGFALFRLFDIFKPPPIKLIEKIGGAWGIMLDDLMAGIFAHIILRIILIFV